MEVSFNTEIGGRTLNVKTGKIAKQASGAVVVQYEETIVLVTVVASDEEKSEGDFLPLSVEYQEKVYAAGRIPGNYHRREVGRPTEKEILTSRLIDRPIRPRFPKEFTNEIQVIATVLSMDQENEPDILSMIGTSCALEISDIPFEGPIAAVRLGRIDGQLIINPKIAQMKKSDINIVVAGSKNGIVMVEGASHLISESELLEAIFFAHKSMLPIIELQEKLKESVGVSKRLLSDKKSDDSLIKKIESMFFTQLKQAIVIPQKVLRNKTVKNLMTGVYANLGEDFKDRKNEVYGIMHDIQRRICRDLVLKEDKRIDGRNFDEIRPISCEIGVLPRTHGSALFTRGETQVLGILTLGSGIDEQRVESLVGEESRTLMLHYNFPPFSVGEVKRIGGPSRRDIGHGGLAIRSIESTLPSKETFDYTIRIVSEVLESNGSSSMGTVCAATLSLIDGGVPIKAPVSGIAMGLIKEGDKVVILSDIIGDEDHFGDMDFKVAGNRDGITAFQMDIKIHELPKDIMEKALEQAKRGRIHILEKMLETVPANRKELSVYAPKVYTIQINPDKIREIIGPGGKIIRSIQSETNCRLEVDDSGTVKISAITKADADAALKIVNKIAMEAKVGCIYDGTVMKIMDFGAFVQILPGTDGLVHISQLSNQRVKKVTDVVKEGDQVRVKVLEIKDGKIRLSIKDAIEDDDEPSAA